MLIAYASRTGTRRNLRALRAAGWRLLVSATGCLRSEGFRYCLDNGAWTWHQRGLPFDGDRFLRAVDRMGEGADFVVLPDIVEGGLSSLELSLSWVSRLSGLPLMLPVQDGMTVADVKPHIAPGIGIFVGGSTAWKEATIPIWAALGLSRGAPVHVGRVNTQRRLRLCKRRGVTSFDGSGPSKWAKCLDVMDRELRQLDLFGG